MSISNNDNEKKALSEYEKQKAEDFAKQLMDAYTREFIFLLVGRTGVGKSSTINQLIGYDIAPVGDFEPQTTSVEEYRLPISNVRFLVIDTPGLCDDLTEKGNDAEYIKKIKDKVKYIDSLLYVTPLSDTRIRSDELRGLEIITKAFGEKIWNNSVIVFTFADAVNIQKYDRTLSERSRLMREAMQRFISKDISDNFKSVAVSNVSRTTPDGQEWLGELYTTVLKRISKDGFIQYLMATAPDIIIQNTGQKKATNKEVIVEKHMPVYAGKPAQVIVNSVHVSPEKHLNERQIEEIRKELVKRDFTDRVMDAGINMAKNVIKAIADTAKSIFKNIRSWLQ